VSDIFISYSRRDKEQALSLAERLRASGCSIWIDTQGIEAATSWSREIVTAIDTCKAVLLLLSSSSVQSHNVIKEVSLASEARKTIIPIDLEHVDLTADLRYQLAGLQRVKFEDFDGIFRGLDRIGAVGGTAIASQPRTTQQTSADSRISLAVLPFEDLSAGKDNEWFGDGLADELINALSNIEALRVTDRRTAMGYKGYKGSLQAIAQALNVRYCIEGAVRKHGEQIKITVALYDSRTTEYIWNEAHRGVMDDIFDIQESVAKKTIEALKVTLSLADKEKLESRLTESSEAYEYYMRAGSLIELSTKQDIIRGIELLDEAIAADPGFSAALAIKASALLVLYRVYEQRPEWLTEAEALIQASLSLNPRITHPYHALATLETIRGNYEAAIEASQKIIALEPNIIRGYMSMGFVNSQAGKVQEAIRWYEKATQVNQENVFGFWNLFVQYSKAGDNDQMRALATNALPLFERRAKLQPNDQFILTALAHFYLETNNLPKTREIIATLVSSPGTDAMSLYNIGCLLIRHGKLDDAVETLARAVENGFGDVKLLRSDPDLDPVRSLPSFSEQVLAKIKN
jgi:TolB-like protein/Flp pilus assembly protein TadD